MANEQTNASLVTNGGRLTEVLAPYVHQRLFDPTDLRSTMIRVPWRALGSSVTSIVTVPAPAVGAAASSETSGGASNTAYTTGEIQLTVARNLVQYQVTDLMGITGGILPDGITLERYARTLVDYGVALRITDMLCTLFGSLATSVGTTTVNLTTDDLFSAMYAARINLVPGPYFVVLHPRQIADLIESLRGETGVMQFIPATAEMIQMRGPGYQGSWMQMDIWQSDSVPTANAGEDRCGALFGYGCFAYQLADVSPLIGNHINAQDVLFAVPEMFLERKRDADNGMTTLILNFYPAVVEVEDLRGVAIITDA